MHRLIGALTAVTAAAAVVLGSAGASHADDQQVLRGAGFPDDSAFLTYVACDGFFGAATPPQLRINLGPDVAPLGRRSMGFVPAAPGTAAGPYTRLESLAIGSALLSVAAEEGTSGVSYVWYSAPDAPAGKAWSGRADVPVAAGGWHEVDASALSYRWTLVDLASRQVVRDGGSASLAGFTAQHGDGPGYVVTGFGCDGHAFNIDAVRAGTPGDVSTFDFEGLQVSTSIDATRRAVRPGGPTVLTGTVTDTAGRVLGDPLVLEERPPGGVWGVAADLVLAEADGVVRHEVTPEATTEYRWVLPESQYADAGVSPGLLVQVGP